MIKSLVDFDDEKLTLLCPVKDRPGFTKRFIGYLIHASCPFKVVIADGSLRGDFYEEVALANSHGLNIKYKKFSPDKSWEDFIVKMCLALEDIQTPYCCLVSDDDFYDFEIMQEGIKFLEENSKYKSFAAEILDFNVVAGNGKGVFGKFNIEESGRHCSGRYKSNQLVEDESIHARLYRYRDVWPSEYIHTTGTLREIFNVARECNVMSYRHLLVIYKYITLIRGPIYYNKISYILRQDNTPNSSGEEMINEFPSYLHFLADKGNAQIESDILVKLVQIVSKEDQYTPQSDIHVALLVTFLNHYQETLRNNIKYFSNTRTHSFCLKVLISTLIRNFYKRVRMSYLLRSFMKKSNFIAIMPAFGKKTLFDKSCLSESINFQFVDEVRTFVSHSK